MTKEVKLLSPKDKTFIIKYNNDGYQANISISS